MRVVTGAEAQAVLADNRWLVPDAAPVGTEEATGEMSEFRAAASRFVNGTVHAERRRTIDDLVAQLADADGRGTARLREAARWAAETVSAEAIPTTALGHALGLDDPETLHEHVALIAVPYASGEVTDARADRAVAELRARVPERLADRSDLVIQLLVQSHAATGGLIRAVIAEPGSDGVTATERVERALRERPPVTATRRVASTTLEIPGGGTAAAGETVEVSLAADGGHPALPFGAGPRRCPAAGIARTIAETAVRPGAPERTTPERTTTVRTTPEHTTDGGDAR